MTSLDIDIPLLISSLSVSMIDNFEMSEMYLRKFCSEREGGSEGLVMTSEVEMLEASDQQILCKIYLTFSY